MNDIEGNTGNAADVPYDALEEALSTAASGADFADVYLERSFHNAVSSDDRKIKTGLSVDQGVGIRIVREGIVYYAFTDSFDPHHILGLASTVRAAASMGAGTGVSLDLARPDIAVKSPFRTDPAAVGIEGRIEIVSRAEEAAWSHDERIQQVTVGLRDHKREIVLLSSIHDSIVEQTLGLTEFGVVAYAARGDDLQRGSHGHAFSAGLEAFDDFLAPGEYAEKASAKALLLLDADECPRGEATVVFAPGENGILFHESCGHGMEADLVEKGSAFSGKMGEAVAAPGVTIFDDGTIPTFPGSFPFDDEGTASQKTVLIESGTLVGYLHSRLTADRQGAGLTGSARRQSFRHPPIPRMRNTCIAAGTTDPAEIIADTKRGIYAKTPGGGGQVDVITGQFVTSVDIAYLIEDGKITRPVKGCTLTGVGIEVLENIDLVGNDLRVAHSSGRCGKGQRVPVGVGMPTLRVSRMLVGGKGKSWD